MIEGKNDQYDVRDVVAENPIYRIRRGVSSGGRELLIQIAIDATKNSELAVNALALTRLAEAADAIEREYAEAGNEGVLNFGLGFPEVCDSFVLRHQGGRQVNVLGFRGVEKVEAIIPLVKITKVGLRVDLRTSAWILGKILKIIAFAHDNRIEVGKISGNNVLIEPDQHFSILFDWSKAVIHEKGVPGSVRRNEVKLAAKSVIAVLGGDLAAARENDADIPYTNYLRSLAIDGESDATKAHSKFYGIVDELCAAPDSVWEPGFYKFRTQPLGRTAAHG